MLLNLGVRLGPYEVVAPLGAGGMGEVYLAEDTRLQRKVAIKLLPSHFMQHADRVRRFEQEARAASALRAATDEAVWLSGCGTVAVNAVRPSLSGIMRRSLRISRSNLSQIPVPVPTPSSNLKL